MIEYLHIGLFVLVAVTFGLAVVVVSAFLGPRKRVKSDLSPYECGIEPVEKSSNRFDVKFYLIALIFLLFDLEVVFLFPWAVTFRELSVYGPLMMIEMGIFLGILMLGLFYVWKKDLLNW
jgi:NADH-quinone oxidoreductase subunit A